MVSQVQLRSRNLPRLSTKTNRGQSAAATPHSRRPCSRTINNPNPLPPPQPPSLDDPDAATGTATVNATYSTFDGKVGSPASAAATSAGICTVMVPLGIPMSIGLAGSARTRSATTSKVVQKDQRRMHSIAAALVDQPSFAIDDALHAVRPRPSVVRAVC